VLFISKCISNKDISYDSFVAGQICIELIQKEKLLCVCARKRVYVHIHTWISSIMMYTNDIQLI